MIIYKEKHVEIHRAISEVRQTWDSATLHADSYHIIWKKFQTQMFYLTDWSVQ